MGEKTLNRGKLVLAFAAAIQATFGPGEWTEIGYITSTNEWIDSHPRLLRSLRWADPDYKEHVFTAINKILDADEENAVHLFRYPPIASWLKEHDPKTFEQLSGELGEEPTPEVEAAVETESGFAALADAHALLRNRGPSSAVDRVHTGLHAFLKQACQEESIEFPDHSTANQLLKQLMEHHPGLRELGPRGNEIRRMIQSSASIIDAMGTLRNRVSLAHANEEILDPEEALLAINLTRSLLRFLDAKLSRREQ